jgi:hypothetical protein
LGIPQTTRSGRESHKPKDYIPNMTGKSYEQTFANVVHHVMTQYSMKAGIKKFGDRGVDAAYAEMEQLHLRDTFKPVLPSGLNREEQKQALESLLFLKEKRDGKLKGRACADGRKQRAYIPKEEAASPTVSLEAVLLTATIDAEEKRHVAVVDIPNAFVQTKMDDKVVMKLRGKLAEIMVLMAPEIYKKYIVVENGVPVLYVHLINALYGTLKAALLFYKKLVKDLESIGFIINPYDFCVANKMINGKQMTIIWHVDDLKISHADEK